MRVLSEEFLISTKEKFLKAQYLAKEESKNDPISEPYKSKYEAKRILQEIEADLNINISEKPNEFSKIDIINALIHYEIGIINIDTEELSFGEQNFKNCIDIIKEHTLDSNCCILAMNVFNQYGILWSHREDPLQAKDWLKEAEKIYVNYKNEKSGDPPINLAEIIYSDTEKSCDNKGWENFEKSNTYTLYYLAQVYEHLKENDRAAIYLHRTLKRQLNHEDFDPLDWVLNCATLSQYFIRNNGFKIGRHYLSCASHILNNFKRSIDSNAVDENNDRLDMMKQCCANVARCWIKYCILLLSASHENKAKKCIEESKDDTYSGIFEEGTSYGSKMPTHEKSSYEPHIFLKRPEVTSFEDQITCDLIHNYNDAKLVFLSAQSWIEEAKTYYVLDEHATNYVNIIQDHSKLYKLLTLFESDPQTMCKMHKRRCDMLEAILLKLNPRYYLVISRQIMFELGEIYNEMMDLKLSIMNKDNQTAHAVQKVNMLVKKSINYFEKFVDSLTDTSTKELPKTFSDDVVHAALIAYFYLGRLHTKIITPDVQEQVKNLKAGEKCYQYIVNYIEVNPSHEKLIQDEYEIIKEMNKLIPGKIQAILSKANVTLF